MSWDEFDGHVQRILANHYFKNFETEDVLKNIVEFAFFNKTIGRVFLRDSCA